MLDSRVQKKKKREKESKRPRQFVSSRLKNPKFRRGKASGNATKRITSVAGESSFPKRRAAATARSYFPRARFRRRLQEPSRRRLGVGVSRPCATGSGRANTETNPRHRHRHHHHHQPISIHRPSTHRRRHYHRQRCRTLSSDAVASTTISSSLPPLLLPALPPPPLFREPSDSLPFNRYPSPPPVPPSAVPV